MGGENRKIPLHLKKSFKALFFNLEITDQLFTFNCFSKWLTLLLLNVWEIKFYTVLRGELTFWNLSTF